jgi:hypothetical protein
VSDHRPSGHGSSYRTADGAAINFCCRLGRGTFRAGRPIAGMAWFCERSGTFSLRAAEGYHSGKARTKPNQRPADGSGEGCVGCHGGACLRRAIFRTRDASRRIDRPRRHAACQRGAMFMAEGRGSPSGATRRAVLNTAPPGPAGRWRGSSTWADVLVANTAPRWRAAWWPQVCGRTAISSLIEGFEVFAGD